jgi:hypothetical protein
VNALVLYDAGFAKSQPGWSTYADAVKWRPLRELCQRIWDAIKAAAQAVVEALAPMARGFFDFARTLTASGLLPPSPAELHASARWTSPLTGQRFRVAGRRGDKHWIPVAPTRYRRKW